MANFFFLWKQIQTKNGDEGRNKTLKIKIKKKIKALTSSRFKFLLRTEWNKKKRKKVVDFGPRNVVLKERKELLSKTKILSQFFILWKKEKRVVISKIGTYKKEKEREEKEGRKKKKDIPL